METQTISANLKTPAEGSTNDKNQLIVSEQLTETTSAEMDDEEMYYPPNEFDVQLMQCAENGDVARASDLLENTDADPCLQDAQTGVSVLMVSAANGHDGMMRLLLDHGAPWNAVDREYLSAGDHASRHGHQHCVDLLMNHAVCSELLLSSVIQNAERDAKSAPLDAANDSSASSAPTALNQRYLARKVFYKDVSAEKTEDSTETEVKEPRLEDEDGLAVMMEWEKDLMRRHAEFVCNVDAETEEEKEKEKDGVSILNVGFGMGLFDTEVQRLFSAQAGNGDRSERRRRLANHVIVEAHPQVLERMRAQGWMDKPNVTVLKGRWQEVLPNWISVDCATNVATGSNNNIVSNQKDEADEEAQHAVIAKRYRTQHANGGVGFQGIKFDGVFFDTYAEDDLDLAQFQSQLLPDLLKPRVGRYSFYNGMCPDNVFFHGVACEVMRLRLKRIGLHTEFEAVDVAGAVNNAENWRGLSARYWHFDKYYLPKSVWIAGETITAASSANADITCHEDNSAIQTC